LAAAVALLLLVGAGVAWFVLRDSDTERADKLLNKRVRLCKLRIIRPPRRVCCKPPSSSPRTACCSTISESCT
jgi:hypothetical protein